VEGLALTPSLAKFACGDFADVRCVSAGKKRGFCRLHLGCALRFRTGKGATLPACP
jgi:hypothetical protein